MASEVIQKLQWRYATKKFDPSKKISEEKLNVLKHSFNLTATSYGLQPIKLLVIRDETIKNDLVAHSYNQVQVRDASHILVFCTEAEVGEKYIKEYFKKVEEVRETPRKILNPFESFLVESFSEKTKEEIKDWMEKQAYLAMGNLLTVCAMEKIDSCPMEGFDPEAYDAYLNLKEKGLHSVLVMPIGYRAEDDMFGTMKKVRRGVENVVIEI